MLKERPCTRCIKRNIGHLCHDEPRETTKRSSRSERGQSAAEDEGSSNELPTAQGMSGNVDVQDAAAAAAAAGQQLLPDGTIGLQPSSVNSAASVAPGNLSSSGQGLGATSQQSKDSWPWCRLFGLPLTDVGLQSSGITTGLLDKVSFKICTVCIPPTCLTHQK